MGLGKYVPATTEEQQLMLESVGMKSFEELYVSVPKELRINELNIPKAKSEFEVRKTMTDIAAKNKIFPAIFRGAGSYNHYIPALVKQIAVKEEFLTAYTPYQAEISQGVLQAIFEFQTMITEITGMDSANASVYDGATAAAEAVNMTIDRKRKKVLVSATANPMTIQTIKTYCVGADIELTVVPAKDGVTDVSSLAKLLDKETACMYIQQPNFFGQIEPADTIGELVHEHKGKFIMGVNPLAVTVLKTPAESGADIVTGEAQPLGLPMAYGGPYLGFMATTEKLTRSLPGRIAGETVDANGERAFVLTLQAREQHIRREKAASNICSNQAHCALTASIYMTTMGPQGVKEVARQSYSKAHYLAQELTNISGFDLCYSGPFFHEFLTSSPVAPEVLMAKLEEHHILGGYPLGKDILWCATEMNTKEQIDQLVTVLKEVTV
ncbi:aminomethyl-transferring glycine dehydrogenase subunit GcvPA [uncultured Vagococcus sp.]|uniref:aminomethyl-transferring glycine dehydrogenase subunit GcvPA n=1 Tax=uncultured Vagococcus sp. TaxID=189676 RepID=UPI0028D7D9A8|nr:aminomethyl-transferring glycine dehydrogenase subunit GcvPA [uncultured Vagococcus sp.]